MSTHAAPSPRGDPLTTFDVRRLNAIRGQQAQIGREIRGCLAELRALRKDALARTDEPEEWEERVFCTNDFEPRTCEPAPSMQNEPNIASRNEPKHPAAVNDRAALPAGPMPRNEPRDPLPANDDAAPRAELRYEPDEPVATRIAILRAAAIMAEHAARFADPERDPTIMDGLVREFGAAWALLDAEAG